MTIATLYPSADTRLGQNAPTTNYGSDTAIYVGELVSATVIVRGLVKFDLSGIPAAASVSAATLRLYNFDNSFANTAGNLRAHRSLRNWVEGEATWNIYSTGNSWGTAGSGNATTDYYELLGSTAISATQSVGWFEISLDTAEIEKLIDGTNTNYGFLLKTSSEANDAHGFYSREGTYQPELVITYTAEAAVAPKHPVSYYSGSGLTIF